MSYELYWISGSPNAWRARLTLEYKALDYVSHRLDPGKGEHKTAAYLALNPRGKLPVLVLDGTPIHESIAIMAAIERACPDRPLFGRDPVETGLIWQRVFETINYTRDAVEEGIVRPVFMGAALKDRAAVKTAVVAALASLQWIEDALGKTPYLAGDTVSAADIAAVTTLKLLERAGKHPDAIELGLDDLPRTHVGIARWFEAMESIPGWDAAYPPHWR